MRALAALALAERVDTEFGQYQRSVDREIVQPRNVAPERGLIMQVDVETHKIGKIDGKIFGGWEIGIADQCPGVLVPDTADKLPQEPPHRLGAMPADHVRRDLVPDQIGKNRRVPTAGPHAINAPRP